MVLNVVKQVTTHYRCLIFKNTVRFYGIYSPPYLKKKNIEIPVYPVLNIQLTGYKYPLLENYQSFIHKLAKVLDITVEDSFALPHKEYKIKKFKKESSITESEYQLRIYERHVQISNVSSIKCPIFIRILEATLPEGVSAHIDNYDPSLKNKSLIPNKELLDLKANLNELLGGSSK
ncbi:unnamed protein product [Xylocopa violacea]|uniref:Small ribosomal subunit protein uS10 domain-containing protein n=1 Tax=Xylocopa violacea TaxID=135666 RepID=A0ABP1NC88_XYLVO